MGLEKAKFFEIPLDAWFLRGHSRVGRALPFGAIMSTLLARYGEIGTLRASPIHVKRNINRIRHFLREMSISQPAEITTNCIEAYLALQYHRVSINTLRHYRAAIGVFCRFLVETGQLPTNPIYSVTQPRLEERIPNHLSPEEVEQALAIAVESKIYNEVAVALYTGLRVGELRRLEWMDVDFDGKTLTVRESKAKHPRKVPLHAKALAALDNQRAKTGMYSHVFAGGRLGSGRGAWNRNRPRSREWWGEAIKPLQEAIAAFRRVPPGTTGRGWHLFRHTFASRAIRAGVSIYKLSKWLGHRSVVTTQIYAHFADGYDAQIERL